MALRVAGGDHGDGRDDGAGCAEKASSILLLHQHKHSHLALRLPCGDHGEERNDGAGGAERRPDGLHPLQQRRRRDVGTHQRPNLCRGRNGFTEVRVHEHPCRRTGSICVEGALGDGKPTGCVSIRLHCCKRCNSMHTSANHIWH